MAIMAQYEDNYFDLAVVDPPYGIGMDGGNVGYNGNNHLQKKEWDSGIPDEAYFIELKRVSKNQGTQGQGKGWHSNLCRKKHS